MRQVHLKIFSIRLMNIFLLCLILVVYSLIIQTLFINHYTSAKTVDQISITAQSFAQKCVGADSKELCFVEQFRPYTTQHTFEQAVQVLHRLQLIDPAARGCHLISHVISTTEAEKDLSKWKDLLAKVDSNDCTGGFIHGVIEAVSSADPNFHLDGKTITDVCTYVKNTQGGLGESNCSHIMGHIALAETAADIPKALKICDQINPNQQFECFSGVYMENMTRDNLLSHGVGEKLPWNKGVINSQEQLCQKAQIYSVDNVRACWREMAHMYAFSNDNKPPKVYELCQHAPTPRSRQDCYLHAVGIMTVSTSFNPDNLKEVCAPFTNSKTDYLSCTEWAMGSMLTSSLNFIDRVTQLCSLAPNDYQLQCFNSIGQRLASQLKDKSKIAEVCQKLPNQFIDVCQHPQKFSN